MPVAGTKRKASQGSEDSDDDAKDGIGTAKKSNAHRAVVQELRDKYKSDVDSTKRQLAKEEGDALKKNVEMLKNAAKLYHQNKYGEELACTESGLTTKSQLQKHNNFLRKKYGITNVRNLSWLVYKKELTWRARGRGDSPTVDEMRTMVEQFGLKCKNVKDCPQQEIWKSVVHEVLEECRGSEFVNKKNYSERFYFNLAKTCGLTFVSLDRVATSRANAIGDWKNVISTIACWLACIIKFRIQPKYVYSMDDTTMFLEEKQVKQRGIVPKAVAAAARALGLRFSLSLKEKTKKHGTHAQRTIKLLAVVSAAGNLVCTIVKITDYAIESSELYRLRPGLYVAMMKGHSKSAVSEEERESRRASSLQFTSRMLVGAVIPSIVQDMILSEHKTKVRIIDDNGDSQPVPGNADVNLDDADAVDLVSAAVVLPRAVLTFDGDFPQIAALMQERVRDGDFEFDQSSPVHVMSPSRSRTTGFQRAPSVADRFAASNIELFKWCAGCSLLHQPLDRSRCFYCLKSALRGSSAFTYRDIHVVAEHGGAAPYIESFIKHQLLTTRIPADSKRSFHRFLLNVEPLCQYAFSSPNIREGFHSTGIACASLTSSHCINMERIFASYGFMSVTITASHTGTHRQPQSHIQLQDLLAHDADVMAKIGAALPALVELAAANGHVSDEQMNAALGAVFAGIGNPLYERCANADQPINHRRCIWMSNATWRASELARIAEKEAAALQDAQSRAAAVARRNASSAVADSDSALGQAVKGWLKLSVPALKELCEAKALQVAGTATRKQPFVDALTADFRSRSAVPVPGAPGVVAVEEVPPPLSEAERIANALEDQGRVSDSSDDDDDDDGEDDDGDDGDDDA